MKGNRYAAATALLAILSGCCVGGPLSRFCDGLATGSDRCDPLPEGLDVESLNARFLAPWSAYECGGWIVVQETDKDSLAWSFFELRAPHELIGVHTWPCRADYGEVDRDCLRRSEGDFRCSPTNDAVCVRSCEANGPFYDPCPSD